MAVTPFTRPIPGQSLTTEPGSKAWERPPQIVDPLDALEMYMERLSDDEVINDVIEMADLGVPLDTIANTMLSTGILRGMHTVDVKVILRPLLTSHIKSLMDVVGIEDYKITFDDYKDDAEAEATRIKNRIVSKLGGIKGGLDEGEKLMQNVGENIEQEAAAEAPPQEEQPMMEEAMPEAAPQGLMAKEQ